MNYEEVLTLAETLVGKDKYDIAIALLKAQKRALREYAEAIV